MQKFVIQYVESKKPHKFYVDLVFALVYAVDDLSPFVCFECAMEFHENSPLLSTVSVPNIHLTQKGLSVFFGVICLVDVFGVFPIVALPGAVQQCGWLGIPLVLTIFLLQMYTAILLGKSWIIAEDLNKNISTKNRYPYAALADMTFGNHLSKLVTILLDITIFCGGIPNIILASQNLQLFGLKMTQDTFDFSYCYWMLILGIVMCPFLWLGSPKDMKCLCLLSVIVVFSISLLIWFCMYNDESVQNIPINLLFDESMFRNIITAYGILVFQFDIHPMLLTIQVDLKDKSQIANIVVYGFLVTTVLFSLTTIFASLKYGLNTYPNILEGLPPSFPLYLTVLLVTMQLCLTCAIGNSALYQHIEDDLNISRDFNYKRCILRSSLTALAVFVAETVPKFDLVMSLIGGTLTGPLVFIFPPLFYMRLMSLQRDHISNMSLQAANHIMYHCESNIFDDASICDGQCFSQNKKYFGDVQIHNLSFENGKCDNWYYLKMSVSTCVICFGIFATCTTTYINFTDAVKYASFSPPCLFNLTMTG